MAESDSAEDGKAMLEALEAGVAGIVLRTNDPSQAYTSPPPPRCARARVTCVPFTRPLALCILRSTSPGSV